MMTLLARLCSLRARLVRAYRVLGDQAAQTRALERARKLFAGRPQDLARIEAEARP